MKEYNIMKTFSHDVITTRTLLVNKLHENPNLSSSQNTKDRSLAMK